jgi:polyisoprenoid-binding protein YceI
MTFKSSKLIFDGDRLVGADGELTMLDVTKPVSLKVEGFMCGENPFNKKPMCGAEAAATIMRSEWGMKTGIPKSTSDQVRLTLPIEAYRE